MNHPSPSPGVEHNAMSVSSELRPLYRLTSVKEECTEEELNSLSNLAKQVVFSFQSKTNSAHIGQECPINCPCKCHLPSPIPAVNEYRPSVIMAPVAREQRGSSVTHFPLRMQVNYKISEGRITPTPRYGKDFCIYTQCHIIGLYHADAVPNEDETAVYGCHCLVNMVVRMRKVLAIRRSWYVCFSAEIGIIQYHRGYL